MSENQTPEGPGSSEKHENEQAKEAKEANIPLAAMLAELRAGAPEPMARKLSFAEQCGVYAALHSGARQGDVARAFNVSPTTVSLIYGCRNTDRLLGRTLQLVHGAVTEVNVKRPHYQSRSPHRKIHYRDVAREFEALGADEFLERYYRPFHARIMEAKARLPVEPKSGPNPRADKYAFASIRAFLAGETFWRIDWLGKIGKDAWAGWWFANCVENGSKPDGEERFRYHGDENDESNRTPFRTSALAYDGVWRYLNLESPRPKPGRPRDDSF